MNVTWFDGNFSSQANHKVDLLSRNLSGFSLEEYNGYSGPLTFAIELKLGFTLPGYYLIKFNGGASGHEKTNSVVVVMYINSFSLRVAQAIASSSIFTEPQLPILQVWLI